jgi:hypothetical protein
MAQAATARWQALTAAVPIMSFKANGEWLSHFSSRSDNYDLTCNALSCFRASVHTLTSIKDLPDE